jgi:hypothetical protein
MQNFSLLDFCPGYSSADFAALNQPFHYFTTNFHILLGRSMHFLCNHPILNTKYACMNIYAILFLANSKKLQYTWQNVVLNNIQSFLLEIPYEMTFLITESLYPLHRLLNL